MIKECSKHGVTSHTELKNGRIKCKQCQIEYQKKHYLKNKDYYKKRARERQKYLNNFIFRFKRLNKCKKCGEKRWWVLDYHHRDNTTKKYTISQLGKTGISIKSIKNEIRKCDILCSNCHRDIHYRIRKIARGHSDHQVS